MNSATAQTATQQLGSIRDRTGDFFNNTVNVLNTVTTVHKAMLHYNAKQSRGADDVLKEFGSDQMHAPLAELAGVINKLGSQTFTALKLSNRIKELFEKEVGNDA